MNCKKFILLSCMALCLFALSPATAQGRGQGGSMGGIGMHPAPMPGSMGRMPMQRNPMLNSASGFRRFNDGRFARFDRFHRFNRFHNFNQVIFIGDFGFPWWWGWGWGPWWGWDYPYGYYGGYDYGGYGAGYGYGDSSSLEWPSYSADWLKRAITMAPSMESWDLRPGERFGPTSATMDT